MGLLDFFSSLFSNKKLNTPISNQTENAATQQTPIQQPSINIPVPQDTLVTPIEEPASVRSIDTLLQENENKIAIPTITQSTNQPIVSAPQAPINPAEPAPGIGTTHTENSLHSNEKTDSNSESTEVKDISL